MAHLLGAESLHLEYPTRVIFDKVTIGLDEGDRIGVVGRNGDGKSTLLRLLSGRIEPDSGRVTRRNGVTLGMLDQADMLPEDLVVSTAIVGDKQEYEWAGDARIRDVIDGLLLDVPWEATIGQLSGGQRRRVALAKLLVGDWDVVFLDEPTNHLDVEGIAWLAGHLNKRWPKGQGGLIVVTHDRWFLDEVSTDTWEVHDQLIEPFEGGYAAYILQRVERDTMAATMESKRQNLARKELAWLRRGAPARTTKPKFRMDAAYELISNEPPPRDTVALSQLAVSRLGKDVVDLLDVGVIYGGVTDIDGHTTGGKEVLKDIEWRVAPGERSGLLGVNGAGKSTMLALIAGTLQPTSGRVKRGKTVKVAILSQQLGELADILDDRVMDVIARQKSSYVTGGKELTPGQLLERMGFMTAQLSTKVRDLSGGQKRRLQLLLILLGEPNVLILDEPTNDLDTDILAAIEDLLDSWPGTLIVVSHDRYLLERVTDNQYAILDKRMRHLPGGVDQYLELRAAQGTRGQTVTESHRAGAGQNESKPAATTTNSKGRVKLLGAELRNAQKELGSVSRKLEKATANVAKVHEKFATHDQNDYTGLATLQSELATLEASLVELETRWLELSEALEP
ncbi:ABC-F family ATP-binding cassette domain-containing protein [Lacisediminihabitans changchengi]|uniref:ABC-F family ATP-binding cassette domain-containing protein n=1 Tax=Lacisediminihabitans changchengi TaxID=2787634 RepID=A0A934SQH9_9MICO|nr:ABC-F family ATP-binding cassette domain-containing protein [Lacisediminihabitans changchengi]MBK4347198.1 ABC-F family ATP-binding cassette domain-containing protein [Lacisediminihabitans changchengi]